MSSESALVILVPEAEPIIRVFRERYDSSASVWVPAHITLLYPFRSPETIDRAFSDGLKAYLSGFSAFEFHLTEIRRFPAEVLYLAPDPEEPFRKLTQAIWDRYPETPPYGGKWPDIVPHLSVAQFSTEEQLDQISKELGRVSRGKLPVGSTAKEVALLDNTSKRWKVRELFNLGFS